MESRDFMNGNKSNKIFPIFNASKWQRATRATRIAIRRKIIKINII